MKVKYRVPCGELPKPKYPVEDYVAWLLENYPHLVEINPRDNPYRKCKEKKLEEFL